MPLQAFYSIRAERHCMARLQCRSSVPQFIGKRQEMTLLCPLSQTPRSITNVKSTPLLT
jgi:hypothetical protein